MPTNPDITLHLHTATGGFTAPMTEAAIEAAITAVHLATRDAETASLRRAQAVLRLVDLFDGNQSEAARRLGLHQSTVNKLVARARAANTPPQAPTGPVRWWALDATGNAVADSSTPQQARNAAESAWLTKHGARRATCALTWEPGGAGWWLLANGEHTEMYVKWVAAREGAN